MSELEKLILTIALYLGGLFLFKILLKKLDNLLLLNLIVLMVIYFAISLGILLLTKVNGSTIAMFTMLYWFRTVQGLRNYFKQNK